jgi:S-(hydroxymethyl)glutathione dehydrogenase/alcohol dehydrogenase
MKAAVLSRLNEPLEVVSGIEIEAPGRGQVLVKLAYSGVCHSQLMEVAAQTLTCRICWVTRAPEK